MCDILKHTTMKTGDKTMKKIHRTLSLFTVAAICTALLCSCGGVPDSSQTDSSSKAATTTTADTTADTTTAGETSSTASVTSAPDSSVSDSSSAVTDDTKTNGITPAMWKVTSPEGNTMVMLGSFHALKDECYPLPEAVTNAYNNADILAVECDITSTSEDGEYMKNLMKQMLYNDNTKLSQHISEEAYSALQTYLGYWGMDISALEVYRPWAVSSTLDTLLIQDSDFNTEKGLDNFLLTTAHADGKEIYEVESVDFQMNMLINFSDDIYDLMLEATRVKPRRARSRLLKTSIPHGSLGISKPSLRKITRRSLQAIPRRTKRSPRIIITKCFMTETRTWQKLPRILCLRARTCSMLLVRHTMQAREE